MMEKEVEERFQRIEQNLERVSQGIDHITEAHLDLEAAQKNLTASLNRFVDESRERGRDVDERIANLAILVDRLIGRDLGKNGAGT
jgi:hypothetical protein